MRSRLHIVCVLLAGSALPPASLAQDSQTGAPAESTARPAAEKLIQESGADVSVAFRTLDGTQELFIQADKQFEDPLALKIPVMIELYEEVAASELKWADPLPVHTTFRRFTDRTQYSVDSARDPDVSKNAGKTMTLRDLCDAMIKDDSDLAANLLVEKLGIDRVRQRVQSLGADGMIYTVGFGDTEAAARGLKNVTSARALMVVLWALQNNRIVSSEASGQMIGLIASSGLEGGTPGITPARPGPQRGPPPTDQHAATITVGAHSFVLVTDVRGLDDLRTSAALVARISHALSAAM
jgi:beta-lactamase class A